jgi:putative DNA methylase
VAVLINKALIEIPPKFAGRPPVHPGVPDRVGGWPRATGLAEDVRYYGQWLRDEAFRRIGHLYPKVRDEHGVERTVIAWIWARTVRSPNPANPIEVPLVRSWWLGKKKGKEAWVKATVVDGQVQYEVMRNADGPTGDADGTIKHGRGARSIADGTGFDYEYVRQEGLAGRLGTHLIAVVAEGNRERLYLTPTVAQLDAAHVVRPSLDADGEIADNPRWFSPPAYGMIKLSDLFTNRQLLAMMTFSDLVAEARDVVLRDSLTAGVREGCRLQNGGNDAGAYADAVSTCLSFAVSRVANKMSSVNSWDSSPKMEAVRGLFARQAIPMSWDYAEANPFAGSSGSFPNDIAWVADVLDRLPASPPGVAEQIDAGRRGYFGGGVSTDPPYYDNIGYSDLSDYFYVWLRRSLRQVQANTVATVLTPKDGELVANPYRRGGKEAAERFFVAGFNAVFQLIRQAYHSGTDNLMTVYYAYKQQESSGAGESSTGWYTLLDGLIHAGWEITATWPVRSELSNRMLSQGTNALASSIVLACRPRSECAPVTTRRAFLQMLKVDLPRALRAMMQGAVAPVDLAQASIGPGMSIFSRYSRVREADGSDMSVRDALLLINATLDEVIDEQVSDFDPETRFCVKWYRQHAWSTQPFGEAETLSRASDTSVEALVRGGIFDSKGGKARLVSPTELAAAWDLAKDDHVSVWEATLRLAAILSKHGQDQVAQLIPAVQARVGLDQVKELGFLLFHDAERKGSAQDALLFNGLVSSWTDIGDQARRLTSQPPQATQDTLNFENDRDKE